MLNPLFSQLLNAVELVISDNADEVAELDRIIGDGDQHNQLTTRTSRIESHRK